MFSCSPCSRAADQEPSTADRTAGNSSRLDAKPVVGLTMYEGWANDAFSVRQLLPQSQTRYQLLIAPDILPAEIGEQAPPAADHLQQSTARVVVVDIGLQMLVEVIDARREDRNLNFRGAGIPFVSAVFLHNLRLSYCGQILSLLLLSAHVSFTTANYNKGGSPARRRSNRVAPGCSGDEMGSDGLGEKQRVVIRRNGSISQPFEKIGLAAGGGDQAAGQDEALLAVGGHDVVGHRLPAAARQLAAVRQQRLALDGQVRRNVDARGDLAVGHPEGLGIAVAEG